ncbi:MAG: beta-ketoacyl-ACP synthase II [Anaerolineales bacterium]|jgi:3-oxoacyl-[acyl-carrier-protein] synthase II
MNHKRVVITGLGAITPLGSSVDLYWQGLLAGRSGIVKITQFDASDLPCQIAGEVPDFEPELYMDRKEVRRASRCAQMALSAAYQAMQDANLGEKMPEPERAGVVYGTAIGGIDRVDEGIHILRTRGIGRTNPFMLPASIPNLPAFLITERFQCLGPSITVTTACATGTQAVGEGTELIRRDAADVVVVGGTEALIADYAIAGFSVMRALPTSFNDTPDKASRPFDARREGFIFSEGAGALILESEEHALARGAEIYAEVIGHASSSDAFHIAAPHPEAAGPIRAMLWALKDAGLQPTQIDYINAHGTSTPLNDPNETFAIKQVFGEHAYNLSISSTKSMIGHPMGAAGSLEAIASALMIKHSIIAPTINYEFPDPECDLDYTPNTARPKEIHYALSNSFGLGGQNACLILGQYTQNGGPK